MLQEHCSTVGRCVGADVCAVQTFVMQPVKREGEVLTYVSGISGFEEGRLGELNQTRCRPRPVREESLHTMPPCVVRRVLCGLEPHSKCLLATICQTRKLAVGDLPPA